jgi:hypothetical protein
VYAVGIKKEYRGSAVRALLRNAMSEIICRYPVVATTWMTEDNAPALRESDLLSLQPDRWFAIYEKDL